MTTPSSYQFPSAPWMMDGPTNNGQSVRTFAIAAVALNVGAAQVWSGVFPSGGGMFVSAPGGMAVGVGTGYCLAASSSGSTYGGYQGGLTAAQNLGIATSDPVNPRIDLVCVTFTDNGDNTSFGEVQVITGTPASSPAAPALPNSAPQSSLGLCQVTVPAGATSIVTGNLNDVRQFTASAGGIVPVQIVSGTIPQGYKGLYLHERATNRLWLNLPAGPVQGMYLPWAPQVATSTTDAGSVATETTLLSVSITTGGSTDVEIMAKWRGIYLAAGAGGGAAEFRLYIDSAQVASLKTGIVAAANSVSLYGGPLIHCTSGSTSDTPSAGTHTVSLRILGEYDGTHEVWVSAPNNSPMQLRVAPVCL